MSPYTTRRLFASLVAAFRSASERGDDIEAIQHDAQELADLRARATAQGVADREWRRQVTRARAFVRRYRRADEGRRRMTSAERWVAMQGAVRALRDDPTLTPEELAHVLGVKRTTAVRYHELAWAVIQGEITAEEAVWGDVGRRGRPRKTLTLPAKRPEIARAVAAALAAAQAGEDMRAAVRAVLAAEDDIEAALRIARAAMKLDV